MGKRLSRVNINLLCFVEQKDGNPPCLAHALERTEPGWKTWKVRLLLAEVNCWGAFTNFVNSRKR